jgi:copper chaperone
MLREYPRGVWWLEPVRATEDPMTTQTYLVEGMTCDHCVAAVTREVGAVAGVDGVAVDLAAGRVAVTGAAGEPAVAAAVAEAGYALVSRA